MYWVKIDVIYSKYEGLVFCSWCLVAPMALEGEVVSAHDSLGKRSLNESRCTDPESFSSTYLKWHQASISIGQGGSRNRRYTKASGRTYWMATRPSTLPIAKPVALGKHDMTRVCHFSGDSIV